jgi:hypothetical protein
MDERRLKWTHGIGRFDSRFYSSASFDFFIFAVWERARMKKKDGEGNKKTWCVSV